MTSALVGVYLRKETHCEFGSPSLLLLNRTGEVRFMCYEFPFRVIFAVMLVVLLLEFAL